MGFLNNIYQKAKKSLNDNEGWFRKGSFTPVTQLTGKSLIQSKPLISPVSQSQLLPRQQSFINPYQEEEIIEPPKPTFKTQAAEKLNSRLDQIKRYGSSLVDKGMDNDGYVRNGKFTPLAPLNDEFKKSTIGKVVNNVPEVAKRVVKDAQQFGTGFGKSMDVKSKMDMIAKQQEVEKQELEKGFALVRELRAQGRKADADIFERKLASRKSNIPEKLKEIEDEIKSGKKELVSGAIKTAEIPLTMAAGLPKIAANMTIGGLLSGEIARYTGEDQNEAVTSGMKDAFGYTGVTNFITNPVINKVLKTNNLWNKPATEILKALKSNPVTNQILQRFIGGAGNVAEDRLLNALDDKENTDLQSFVIGAALTGNEPIAKGIKNFSDKYILGRNPDIKSVREIFRNKLGQFAPHYNRAVDSLITKQEPINFKPANDPDFPDRMIRVGDSIKEPIKYNSDFRPANDPNFPNRMVRVEANRPPEEMMGGLAGMETYQDENGDWKIRFNPAKAALGIGVASGIKSEAGQDILKNIKLPETKAPEGVSNFIPANAQPEISTKSIADIFSNRTNPINIGDGYKVKGQSINFEKMLSEGWQPDQVDYAIKLANDAKVTPDNVEAYVRGILKVQYPNQAAKMGRNNIPLPPEPGIDELSRMDRNAGDLIPEQKPIQIADLLNKQEVKPISPEIVEEPKTINKLLSQTELEKQTALKKAELEAGDILRADIDAKLKAEGFDNSPLTAEKIMSGELPASPELKAMLDVHSKELGQGAIQYKGLPEDKLKENYVPHVRSDLVTPVDTQSDDFISMMNRNSFDPTKKRTGTLAPEKMADTSTGFRQEHISILNEKFYAVEQANKIMAENNLPKEKGDEVLKFVEKEKANADKVLTEHIEKTDFGKSRDYLSDAYRHQDELSKLTGVKVDRPIVAPTFTGIVNQIDNLQSSLRGDAMFFKDKTNKDIYDSFIDFRMSQNGESKEPYGVALNRFINKLQNYEYADPPVRERVNLFIDDKLKENKVIENLAQKSLRGVTEVFSMAQIGGNIKTVITQPTEVFRLIPEHGVGSFTKGIVGAFNPKESARLVETYGLQKEISGNLAQNPLYKEVQSDPALKDKVYDSFKNILFKGLQVTENWKNIAYASALEDAGKKQGLEGEPLKKFVMSEMLRLAHMADTDMTPRIMKNNSVTGSLLQYSQYLLKNEVLKWNTIVAKDKTVSEKLKKVFGLFLADFAAIGTMSAITGVGVDGIRGWLSNSGLPNNFGPILTVPAQMAKEAYDFSKLTPEEQEKQTPLMDREKAILFRNFSPMGNQLTKSASVYNPVTGEGILQKGYAESKKGNVNYVVGDINPIQKAQAVLFGAGALPAKKEANKRWNNLDKDGIFPTLTSDQSEVLKSLPKEEQKAFYDSKMESQKSSKDLMESFIKKDEKKPNLISKILGKKDETQTYTIPGKDATPEEKKLFNSRMKAFVDSGNVDKLPDEQLRHYFYSEVDKMPATSPSEKQNKNIALFNKLDSIYASETLDEETKNRLIDMSGLPKEEVEYYNLAKDDSTVKAMRQEELAGTMKREDWLNKLEEGRRLVGNKQIVDNATLDQLYERGVLSDAERDYLKAVKFDPGTNEYYLDRDYKNSQANASASASKKKFAAFNALQNKLDTINNRNPSDIIKKSISSYLSKETGNKSTSRTISETLGSRGTKKVTPKLANIGNIKRVKSKYR